MSKSTSGLHDPYENQLAAARYRAERDALAQAMQRVADSMREHALGVEGMEDSPVSGWERELRAALGGMEHIIGTMIEYRRVLNGVCKRLGLTDGTGMPEQDGVIYGELEKRLMPEGYEWPRYESGEPVPIGGEFMGKDGKTYTAKQIQFIGKCFSLYDFCDRKPQFNGFYGERVKRPAVLAADNKPLEAGQTVYHIESGGEFTVTGVDAKSGDVNLRWGYDFEEKTGSCAAEFLTHQRPVLDAKGVPIKKGDTVWHIETGREYVVVEPSYGETVVVRLAKYDDAEGEQYAPDQLTHRAPVLAADGKTLLKHETVYEIKTGERYFVTNVFDGMTEPDFPEHTVECRKYEDVVTHMFRPSQLTHERPDSWERLERDANASTCTYFGATTKDCDICGHVSWECSYDKARDLVRRCRALAERERGE